eukprot:gene2540-4953_t
MNRFQFSQKQSYRCYYVMSQVPEFRHVVVKIFFKLNYFNSLFFKLLKCFNNSWVANMSSLKLRVVEASKKLKEKTTEMIELKKNLDLKTKELEQRLMQNEQMSSKIKCLEKWYTALLALKAETRLLVTGEVKCDIHMKYYENFFDENRSKTKQEAYKPGAKFVMCSSEGIQYTMKSIKKSEGLRLSTLLLDASGGRECSDVLNEIGKELNDLVMLSVIPTDVRLFPPAQRNNDDTFAFEFTGHSRVSLTPDILLTILSSRDQALDMTFPRAMFPTVNHRIVSDDVDRKRTVVEEEPLTESLNDIKRRCGIDPSRLEASYSGLLQEAYMTNPSDAHHDQRVLHISTETQNNINTDTDTDRDGNKTRMDVSTKPATVMGVVTPLDPYKCIRVNVRIPEACHNRTKVRDIVRDKVNGNVNVPCQEMEVTLDISQPCKQEVTEAINISSLVLNSHPRPVREVLDLLLLHLWSKRKGRNSNSNEPFLCPRVITSSSGDVLLGTKPLFPNPHCDLTVLCYESRGVQKALAILYDELREHSLPPVPCLVRAVAEFALTVPIPVTGSNTTGSNTHQTVVASNHCLEGEKVSKKPLLFQFINADLAKIQDLGISFLLSLKAAETHVGHPLPVDISGAYGVSEVAPALLQLLLGHPGPGLSPIPGVMSLRASGMGWCPKVLNSFVEVLRDTQTIIDTQHSRIEEINLCNNPCLVRDRSLASAYISTVWKGFLGGLIDILPHLHTINLSRCVSSEQEAMLLVEGILFVMKNRSNNGRLQRHMNIIVKELQIDNELAERILLEAAKEESLCFSVFV